MATTDEPQRDGYNPYDDPDNFPSDRLIPKDWALHDLLDLTFGVNDESEEGAVSLTVMLGGTLVSGTAITAGAWYKGVAERLRPHSGEFAEAYEKIWGSAREVYRTQVEDRESRDLPALVRSFVCFRDVVIFTPVQEVRREFWRVSLDDVTGWDIGSFDIQRG